LNTNEEELMTEYGVTYDRKSSDDLVISTYC